MSKRRSVVYTRAGLDRFKRGVIRMTAQQWQDKRTRAIELDVVGKPKLQRDAIMHVQSATGQQYLQLVERKALKTLIERSRKLSGERYDFNTEKQKLVTRVWTVTALGTTGQAFSSLPHARAEREALLSHYAKHLITGKPK